MARLPGVFGALVVLPFAAWACGGEEGADGPGAEDAPAASSAAAAGPPSVYVVNYPLAYMAERIGGDAVRVVFPAPSDLDPALWSPGPDVVAEYQDADLILLNGAGYAGWTTRVTLPESRIFDTTAGLEDRFVTEPGAVTHSHGPEGEHAHDLVAVTTWLDLDLAAAQAGAVAQGLGVWWPEAAGTFAEALAPLEADLGALDAEQRAIVDGREDTPILGSRPVYQYLAERYGLNLRAVQFEADEVPADAAWRELSALLREHPAEWMLWDGEPLPETRDRLEGMGVQSVVYDPAGNRPATGDFMTVMQANVEALREVYGS